MRYFLELAYNGAAFHGWQRQPQQMSVQQVLEDSFSTILGRPIDIVGCGRTDTGVHASQYFAHFEYAGDFPKEFLRRINKYLPDDVVIYRLYPVDDNLHARFSAHYRAYRYHVSLVRDPFRQQTVTYYPYAQQLDTGLMQEAAQLLLNYELFAPFCKSGSDVEIPRCDLYRCEWEFREQEYILHIAANRFLRGMVRLIVGMCLDVGRGKTSLVEVQLAMDNQTRLDRANSAPPNGLFLTEVRYPE